MSKLCNKQYLQNILFLNTQENQWNAIIGQNGVPTYIKMSEMLALCFIFYVISYSLKTEYCKCGNLADAITGYKKSKTAKKVDI